MWIDVFMAMLIERYKEFEEIKSCTWRMKDECIYHEIEDDDVTT